MNMKANRAGPSDIPSPTFTYATTYTVPRSSPMLSSSFTPFYPRSQQQIYSSHLDHSGNRDPGCYASPQELNDAHKSHLYEWPHVRDPKFYNQCYTSSGSDPYKVCWVSNNGDVWGGGAWQSGNPIPEEYVYADDEAEDSAYLHSDSLSYYAESPGMEQEFNACSTSNSASVSTLYPDPGAASFNASQSGAQLDQASCFLKVEEHLPTSSKNSFIQDQAVPYRGFEKLGLAKSRSNGMSNVFSSNQLDARPFSIQVSSHICSSIGNTSPVVEPKMKQATTDMTENRCAQTNSSSKPSKESRCKSSDEHGLLESMEFKGSIEGTSNSTNTLQLLEGNNLDAPTMSITAEVNQKEADNTNSLSPQSNSTQILSTSGQRLGLTLPKHINAQSHNSSMIESGPFGQRNMASLLNRPSPVMEMESKPCVEVIDHEAMHQCKVGSSLGNGSQLLVKCIHNLSKVLLSSQPGASLNFLDPADCFAIKNTICILSHRLYQSSIHEGNFCQDQKCHQAAEQESNMFDDKLKCDEEAGRETSHQKSSFLLESMKHKGKAVSPCRVLENDALNGLSKAIASTSVEGDERAEQSSFVKKEFKKPLEDLLLLQHNVTKLQEEVAYERAESNATVMSYKKLWSEAQEALKVSRLEMEELRAELSSLKQDLTNQKHLEGPGTDAELTKFDMQTFCINQGSLHENLLDVKTGCTQCSIAPSSMEPFSASSGVATSYFTLENISNCRENWSSYAKGEDAILRHNNQSGKRFEVSAIETAAANHIGGTNLDDEVTQRLSLLLARPGLDLNKTHADRNVELASGLSPSLEASSSLPREGETMPPDKKEKLLIWSEKSYFANAKKGKPPLEIIYGDHGLVQRQSNSRNTEGVNAEDVNVSTTQEDEIEIICLKPGVAESSFTYLKEEPEWEHVVVNALDDHKRTRKGNYSTPRKGDQ